MDGLHTHKNDGRVIMKDCVQQTLFTDMYRFCFQQESNQRSLAQQCISLTTELQRLLKKPQPKGRLKDLFKEKKQSPCYSLVLGWRNLQKLPVHYSCNLEVKLSLTGQPSKYKYDTIFLYLYFPQDPYPRCSNQTAQMCELAICIMP